MNVGVCVFWGEAATHLQKLRSLSIESSGKFKLSMAMTKREGEDWELKLEN